MMEEDLYLRNLIARAGHGRGRKITGEKIRVGTDGGNIFSRYIQERVFNLQGFLVEFLRQLFQSEWGRRPETNAMDLYRFRPHYFQSCCQADTCGQLRLRFLWQPNHKRASGRYAVVAQLCDGGKNLLWL